MNAGSNCLEKAMANSRRCEHYRIATVIPQSFWNVFDINSSIVDLENRVAKSIIGDLMAENVVTEDSMAWVADDDVSSIFWPWCDAALWELRENGSSTWGSGCNLRLFLDQAAYVNY